MTTPDNITELKPNEYIVVGTNYGGIHAGGAAKYAHEHFGLQWGCGEGLSGQTYALPTMYGLQGIRSTAMDFISFAKFNPDKTFYLTKVGTGIAGHKESEIAPLFADTSKNVIKPKGW